MKRLLFCAALLLATPASAGDYAIFDCKPTKVLLSIPAKGKAGFFTFKFNREGQFTDQKELPDHLFRIEYGKRNEMYVYYRGKLCIELDE
jgi:hypothetical protein